MAGLYSPDRILGGSVPPCQSKGPRVNGRYQWLIADHQGSVIADANASGATQRHAYGPYGEPASWAGPRFRYTGQAALPEAQLYHYKARVYDPLLGRFLQTDPVGYQDDLNLYAYVTNDPLNGVDPKGNDVVVLNDNFFWDFYHQGVLVGDDEGGWNYYSLEGSRDAPWQGRPNWDTGRFSTLEDALRQLGRRYEEAYRHRATARQDAAMRSVADQQVARMWRYNALCNNCGDFVRRVVQVVDPLYPNSTNPRDAVEYLRFGGERLPHPYPGRWIDRPEEDEWLPVAPPQAASGRTANGCPATGGSSIVNCGAGLEIWE